MADDVQRLTDDIRQRRGPDTVVAFEPIVVPWRVDTNRLDQFAERVGLSGIGDQWREVNPKAAVTLAVEVLVRDLAYSVRIMPDSEAQELAERFVRVFAPDARFFTNTDYKSGTSSWGWMPLTVSTFDAGIMGVDATTIGVLVVQDED